MKIINEHTTFSIISLLDPNPDFDKRFEYAAKLRDFNYFQEANELEHKLNRDEFDYLVEEYFRKDDIIFH